MRFKDVFSIIGPAMIGPSSSHTAGAARIGRAARQALGEPPLEADIALYGSFADTYRGHGTDKALVAGLLGHAPDDERLRDALAHAELAGLQVSIRTGRELEPHPNTASIALRGRASSVTVKGRSIGGGSIELIAVDRFDVRFAAAQPTLLIFHEDRPGTVARIAAILDRAQGNIVSMTVGRQSRQGAALTVMECDQAVPEEAVAEIGRVAGVSRVRTIDLSAEEADA